MSRMRLSYANVTATVALVIAMSGSAVAATLITGADIRDRSVPGVKLEKDTVTGAEVAESKLGAVPNAKQVNGASVQHLATQLTEGTQATAAWAKLGSLPGLAALSARCLTDLNGSDNTVVRVENTTAHDLWLRVWVTWPGGSPASQDGTVLAAGERRIIDVDASQGSDAIGGFQLGFTDGTGGTSADVIGTAVNRPHGDSTCAVELTAVSK